MNLARPEAAQLLAYCRSSMQRGSVSFFLAARLAGESLRAALMILYSWCRFCDDAVDQADQTEAVEARTLAVDELRRRTWEAMHGGSAPLDGGEAAGQGSVFAAFSLLTKAYQIPDHYPQELLSGMDMDVAGESYRSFAELRLYCYRVAGTVGLMFSHLAGVSDERALQHAADLGTAMQLTNIARDVLTDVALGRVYLPLDWLAEAGISAAEVGRPECRERVALVVARLLDEADRCYASGSEGLRFLPWRAAMAAAAARFIYAEIGVLVRRRGTRAWDRRAVVPLYRKLILVFAAAWLVLGRDARSRLSGWRSVPIRGVWRFS